MDRLRTRLAGRLVLPPDAGYDTALQLQSAQFDAIRPRGIAYCANASDVSECVRFALDNGIPVTARAGGHSSAGYSTTDGLVVDLSILDDVVVGRSTIRIGAGAQAVDVLAALEPHGRQVATGTCATVCAGGFLLGGGHGPQARKFGLASDRLVAADVVLADGTEVRASAHEHPDLFWALRGAGGCNFGIVTALEVRPTRVPSMVTFDLTWDWADALDVLTAWQDWVIDAPGELAARFWVAAPGAAAAPQVLVHGAYLGAEPDCARSLDRLVAAVARPPVSRCVADLPYTQAMMRIFNCANRTVAQSHRVGHSPQAQLPRDHHISTRNRFLTQPMPPEGSAAALAAFAADRRPAQFRIFGMYAFGARINELAPDATAYCHRDAQLSAFASLNLITPDHSPDDREAARTWVDRCFDTIDPFSNGESFQNFMDPALKDWRTAYHGSNYPRLRAVKHHYDPHTLFQSPQSIA
ncbi:FAD-binding oxidoreductase [Actinophytocola sp.]|uniref:FAD-binding oxidoreductase n=1 Tax=Actinophytocola sp. TaxID=1872138 RepID=UPI002D7E3967|nr:FAD-binding oxidoreductase [Actinophytocola sp.]HET9141505.1 FAD-binding oxidoreductase [Actinophytocola sp.]